MNLLRVERHGRVRVLVLNDPGQRNLLSGALCAQISEAVANANADQEASAIVITGEPPAFCAGAHLNDLEAAADGRTETINAVYRSFLDVANSALPTIAAVNGPAVGAGFNLALACDIRLAAGSARFDCRFLKIGLHPGGGHTWMLLRAVSWAQASRMLLFDRALDADEAKSAGLVQKVFADSALIDEAIEFARRAEALPRELLVRTKETMRMAAISDHATVLDRETGEQMRSLQQPAFKTLVANLKARISKSNG